MNKIEAVIELLKGTTLRRRDWEEKCYIHYCDTSNMVTDNCGTEISLIKCMQDDFTGYDSIYEWEKYVDPTKELSLKLDELKQLTDIVYSYSKDIKYESKDLEKKVKNLLAKLIKAERELK